jgi:drug/metabolite transporter (DMT)-like permease
LIVDGKFATRNFLGYLAYICSQTWVTMSVFFTLYTSTLATLNPGIATSLWAVTPFFMALFDWFFLKNKLGANYIFGISLIVLAVILISLKDVITDKIPVDGTAQVQVLPTFVPVLIGFQTPVALAFSAILGKHLC